MHPVIAKLTPVIKQLRDDRSQTIDAICINPTDADEIGLRMGDLLFGVPVIRDASRPRLSAMVGTTQARDAFDAVHNR